MPLQCAISTASLLIFDVILWSSRLHPSSCVERAWTLVYSFRDRIERPRMKARKLFAFSWFFWQSIHRVTLVIIPRDGGRSGSVVGIGRKGKLRPRLSVSHELRRITIVSRSRPAVEKHHSAVRSARGERSYYRLQAKQSWTRGHSLTFEHWQIRSPAL